MIRIKDLSKYYRIGDEEVHALDHASLHVSPGEFVGIIGPSGSGKSTLMNIIGCLDVADSGEYLLDGIPIENYSENELAHIRNRKRANHFPTELSGGQQQRVAIARAIVTRPSLILADEPTGNLDSKTTVEIMDIFHELHSQGNTIVLITHDDSVAAQAGRRVRILDGHLTEEGA